MQLINIVAMEGKSMMNGVFKDTGYVDIPCVNIDKNNKKALTHNKEPTNLLLRTGSNGLKLQ